MIPLYLDVHVPAAIFNQLSHRGVDVVTAQQDGARQLADDELLDRAAFLGRLLFTQDIRFKALAETWQRTNRPFAGLLFGHQLHGSVGQYVRDLEFIARVTEPADWVGMVLTLPLR